MSKPKESSLVDGDKEIHRVSGPLEAPVYVAVERHVRNGKLAGHTVVVECFTYNKTIRIKLGRVVERGGKQPDMELWVGDVRLAQMARNVMVVNGQHNARPKKAVKAIHHEPDDEMEIIEE